MRPERDNIPVPELPDGITWFGEGPASISALTARGPTLVHFFDFAQLNSVRTLPYLIEWNRRYRDAGLSLIGVQAPRFPFGFNPEIVADGLLTLGVDFPVAFDFERELWHSYGCRGWPSLFLWSRGGALAWFHFAEGDYLATEEAIQAELRGVEALRRLPPLLSPLRPTDGPGTRVIAPSPEVFPGGSWQRAWTAGVDGADLQLRYGAGGAYATAEGHGEIALELDGRSQAAVSVEHPALYKLTEHNRHESHTITLRPSAGLRLWSISFAAGLPPGVEPANRAGASTATTKVTSAD